MRQILSYGLIVFAAVTGGAIAAEIYLSRHVPPRLVQPFYNVLYPYVMFRPVASSHYEPAGTFAMSHFKSRAYVYTNEDGFRIPSQGYNLPKKKPAGQLRIVVLGGSVVILGSTYESTLPGSLRALLRGRYPGRDIEVINGGITSCVSRQSIAELLFTVVDYHPDIVILYDGGNDLGLPFTYESRPNFPYNFQSMQEAWDLYRAEREQPLWRLALARSNLYRVVRTRLHPNERKMTPAADAPFAGSNVVTPGRILADPDFVREHVAAYLSNWRKLVELSAAYRYQPICVLSAAGGLRSEWAATMLMQQFHLDSRMAHEWLSALSASYDEAGRQIGGLRSEYPNATFLDLSSALEPPEKYFSDLDHLYDEANGVLAQRLYADAGHSIEKSLREVR